MDLLDDDLEFLDDVTKGLGTPDTRDIFEIAQTNELGTLYKECAAEAGEISVAGLCANGPRLAAIIISDPHISEEFGRFRDGFFLYALARGYAAGREAAQLEER